MRARVIDIAKELLGVEGDIHEMVLDGIGCKRSEGCTCFHCSISSILHSEDEIDSAQLKAILPGLMGGCIGRNPQKEDIMTPQHFAGIAHGFILALECMNVPAFITQDPNLIRSTIVQMMKKSAEHAVPDLNKRLNDALKRHREDKSNG